MAVSGAGSVHGAPSVRPVAPTPPGQSGNGASEVGSGSKPLQSPRDEVDISSAGRMMNEAASPTSDSGGVDEMRAARLAQIKAAIDDGTYDTDERLESALSRMFDRVVDDMD